MNDNLETMLQSLKVVGIIKEKGNSICLTEKFVTTCYDNCLLLQKQFKTPGDLLDATLMMSLLSFYPELTEEGLIDRSLLVRGILEVVLEKRKKIMRQ